MEDAARLYRDNYAGLCRYLYRFTADSDASADAAQEAFVRMLEKPPSEHARAWLYKVATNLALESGRTRRRRLTLLAGNPDRTPHGDPELRPDEAYEAGDRKTRVQRALQTLSEKERMALLMREEGFAQKEIAVAVGTTTGSVGTLIARALDKLADRLGLDQEEI